MADSKPLDRVVLMDVHHKGLRVELIARIDEQGNLVLEGWDRGDFVKAALDDSDYEYWLKVPRAYKDTVLLWLIQERFANDSEFRAWLNAKAIPNEFSSYT